MGVAPLTPLEARRLGVVRRYFAVHPVAMDVVVCVVYALLSLVLSGDRGSWIDAEVRWTVGLVAAAALALFWRRRLPIAVVWTTVVIAAVSLFATGDLGAVDLAYSFALYAVAANCRLLTAWATFGATLLVL